MSIRTIFDACRPRGDVMHGTVAEADFAADLAQVVTGGGSPEYVDPVRFFANTYPTRGLKNLLANVCRRLSGAEHRVLKRLARAGVKLGSPVRRMTRGYALTEDLALTLGLLFRALAPMRSRDNMRAVAEGIEAMGREEAAYWLGMAMHRRRPRRVLTALRMLLTEPRPRGRERS